jgi:small GTP-binding protein
MQHVKCSVLGGENKHRVALLITYTRSTFPPKDRCVLFETCTAVITVEDVQVYLYLWDIPYLGRVDNLRSLLYPGTRVLVICFSLVSPSSLEDVQELWLPEIKERCPAVPYILVGLLSDVRDSFEERAEEYRSRGWEPIPTAKGEEMKKVIGARAYIECSAKTQYNVKEVFATAAKVALHPQEPEPERNPSNNKKGCQVA